MNARQADFRNRAKTTEGRRQLVALRNGEINAMQANGALYQKDRRRKSVYRAWEENWIWIKEINEALGIDGLEILKNDKAWMVIYC